MKKDSSNGIAFSHAIGRRMQMSGRGVKKIPRNNGIATLPPASWAEPGTTIRAEQHNVPLRDIEAMLTNSLPRDGSAPMTGNLPMNSRRITGLGTGVDPSDAARIDQIPPTSVFLTSLASLVAVANQMPYADATGAAAFTTLTPFARSILDDAAAADVRTTLGLGSLAVASPTGTTGAGKYLRGDMSWHDLVIPPALGGASPQWNDFSGGGRVAGTTYQNTRSYPIQVSLRWLGSATFEVSNDNITWIVLSTGSNTTPGHGAPIIQPGGRYRVAGSMSGGFSWAEYFTP